MTLYLVTQEEAEEEFHFGNHQLDSPLAISIRWHVNQLVILMLEQQEHRVGLGKA
jgi:hypothetical protein